MLRRVCRGPWRGVAVDRPDPLLARILDQPDQARSLPGFTVLKDEKSVTVYRVGAAGELCIKEHRPGDLARKLKRSRARSAFRLARAARALELRVPEPLAALDQRRFGLWRRGLFITRFVSGLESLKVVLGRPLATAQRRRLALELADAVRRLHDGRWVHADLKFHNMKVDQALHPWMFDLERGYCVSRWPAAARYLAQGLDLAKLMASSGPAVGRREQLYFLARYLRRIPRRALRRRTILTVLRFYFGGAAQRQGKTLVEILLWPNRPPQ
jgi:hypothetical protein